MSRIHEALKKAEQERVVNQGGVVEAPPAPGFEGGGAAVGSIATAPEFMAAPPVQSMSSSPFNLDTRCAQYSWKPDPSTMLFLNGNSHGQGSEEFRTLRARLYHLREQKSLKKVLVTSALPKEGKSFTAANLAQVMVRQPGRKALLIDADLRSPRLHMMLGTTPDPGLSDYLQGTNDEFSIMQRGPVENLFFIPSGSGIADPSELVSGGRLKLLLQRVEPLFDWIIVDSPPALLVSDAGVLAKACDGVLMVVRSTVTPADVARKAREEFPEDMLLGVVLNGTRGRDGSYERYYDEEYPSKKDNIG
jgi:capsular exopolysaccharide synthesis family protein